MSSFVGKIGNFLKNSNILRAIAFGVSSGIATTMAFPMFYFSYFAFFSFIFLFIAIEIFTIVPALVATFMYVVVFYGYLLDWLEFFHPLALLGTVLALAAYHMVLVSVYLFLRRPEKKGGAPSLYNPFLLAWLFIVLEYIRNLGFLRFPYGNIAYSQFEFLPFIQIAEITGYLGVSFFIYLCNAFFAQWIIHFPFFIKCWQTANGGIYWRKVLLNRFVVMGYAFIIILGFGFARLNFLNKITEVKENPSLTKITSQDLFSIQKNDELDKIDAHLKNKPTFNTYTHKPLHVAIIQPWFDYNMIWTNDSKKVLLKKLFSLSKQAVKNGDPDLIIWPETAIMCYYVYQLKANRSALCRDYVKFFKDFSTQHQSKFLAGSLGAKRIPLEKVAEPKKPADEKSDENGDKNSGENSDKKDEKKQAKSVKTRASARGYYKYNAALFLENNGKPIGMHGKKLLVPFAEYFPYKNLLKHMKWLENILSSKGTSNFTPFDKYTIFFHEQMVPFGTMICYEDCFPEPAHTMTLGGAKFLIVVTNDAWGYSEKSQILHYIFTPFRAIENRRPILRAGNAGVSGLVQATGKLSHDLEQFKEDFTSFSFRPLSILTIYNTISSNIINILMLLFLGLYLPYVFVRFLVKSYNQKKKK